eukprot:gb/GEZN01000187.1/.p1 GENE.gb/GEZN01000187.1/~~gb/GEZN01000187.1/.p1  ORF type:complete len:1967 (+),score=435.69 gb/GEZN01000187.1/:681-5903(+)
MCPLKLRVEGQLFLAHLLRATPEQVLTRTAPLLLKALLQLSALADKQQRQEKQPPPAKLVTSVPMGGAVPPPPLRPTQDPRWERLQGMAMSSLGHLCSRVPTLANQNPKMLLLLFQNMKKASEEEKAGLVQNLHEGLNLLRRAYCSSSPEVLAQLQTQLWKLVQNPNRRVKLAALQCSNVLYGFDNCQARFLCLQLVDDSSLEVREEARHGLTPQLLRQRRRRDAIQAAQAAQAGVGTETPTLTPNSPSVSSPATSREEKNEQKNKKKSQGEEKKAPSEEKEEEISPMELLAPESYPAFPAFMTYLAHPKRLNLALLSAPEASAQKASSSSSQLSALQLDHLLKFCMSCLDNSALVCRKSKTQYARDLLGVEGGHVTEEEKTSAEVDERKAALFRFQTLLEQSFTRPAAGGVTSKQLQDTASSALLDLLRWAPEAFGPAYLGRLSWLTSLLTNPSADEEQGQVGGVGTRATVAQLLALVVPSLPHARRVLLLKELAGPGFALVPRPAEFGPEEAVSLGKQRMREAGTLQGALLGIGVLLAACLAAPEGQEAVKDNREEELQLYRDCTALLCSFLQPGLAMAEPGVAGAACAALGRAGAVTPLLLPATLYQSSSEHPEEKVTATAPSNKRAKLEHVGLDGSVQRREVARLLLRLGRSSEKGRQLGRLQEEAIGAAGRLAVGDRDPELLTVLLKGLFAMSAVKQEEIHFSVGASLARVASGHDVAEDLAELDEESIRHDDELGEAKESVGQALEPKLHLTWQQDTSTEAEADEGGEGQVPMALVLDWVIGKYLGQGSKNARGAACVWLLCLVRFQGSHPLVRSQLPRIQKAFSFALGEEDQFIQECAAKGISLVYTQGDKRMKKDLVAALTQVFSAGKRRVTQDTEVSLDESKGEIATYKELVSVAKDIGQPDLVYKFLDMAAHHSVWQSKLGAAFGLGALLQQDASLAKAAIEPILPKLFRYQYDPNDKIKRTMRQLWATLVQNPRQAVSDHFDRILSELEESLVARQWRTRHSACLAVCDLIQGRSAEQVAPHLPTLYNNTFKVLDDIKDSVREVSMVLAKALTSTCVRLADPHYTSTSGVKAVLDAVVPLLLQQGITHSAKEARMVSVDLILKLVEVGGKHLRPHLAELLGALMEGLTSIEPAVLGYLQFHTANMNLSPEQLEQVRLSMSQASPLAAAIQSCSSLVDDSCLEAVLHKMSEILRVGVGLPTLTGAGRLLATLVQGPLGPAMQPHAAGLIRLLQQGLNDQSPSVRKVYSTTMGYLCRVAKKKRVGKVVSSLVEMYGEAANAKDPVRQRQAAGQAVLAVVKHAPDQAKLYTTDLAPAAFLAMHDTDETARLLWEEVWELVAPGTKGGVELYAEEIVARVLQILEAKESSYEAKATASKALARAMEIASPLRFADSFPALLSCLESALPGRLWTGKEDLLALLATALETCNLKVQPEEAKRALAVVLAEAARTKLSYLRAALPCLARAGASFPTLQPVVFRKSLTMLSPLLDQALEAAVHTAPSSENSSVPADTAEAKAEKKPGEKDEEKVPPLLLVEMFSCLSKLWPGGPTPAQSTKSNQQHQTAQAENRPEGEEESWYALQKSLSPVYLFLLDRAMRAGLLWNVRVTVLEALGTFVQRIHVKPLESFSPVLTPELCAVAVSTASQGVADGKYGKVRTAGLKALLSLLKRLDQDVGPSESKRLMTGGSGANAGALLLEQLEAMTERGALSEGAPEESRLRQQLLLQLKPLLK